MAEQRKKIVRASNAATSKAKNSTGTASSTAEATPTWSASPEAKAQATKLRWIAAALWVVAIAGEAFAIFWLLRQDPFTTALLITLIALIVVIGALAVGGALLWKKANDLDPASRKEPVRFWVQNQLGVIIAIIAFLPLIILIFTNKNMDGKQKAIAGSIGVVVAVAAALLSADWNPPSVEQYSEEQNIIQQLTGQDEVYWTKSGSVFHVCEAVPDVNKESADGQIYVGTVAEAHAEGKDRLTKKWESEATKHCGYTQEQVDAVKAGLEAPADDTTGDDAEVDSEDGDDQAPADDTGDDAEQQD
ncbi:hypothetical protein [Microbacterium sp. YY-01]|uniref:hypothetical protein n=1 Tax=Microbacterium sp. YY-01 TaxID=3421634 RepID=UPI003D1704D4